MSALAAVTLDDKYTLDSGRIYLTGMQALVRLPLMQRLRDQAAGLEHRRLHLRLSRLAAGRLRPGAVAGAEAPAKQPDQVPARPQRGPGAPPWSGARSRPTCSRRDKYDGVFAMWYGKGPGVDRSGDVFKHGNAAGTSPHGGVLALAGDDHTCQSSTLRTRANTRSWTR